MCCNVDYNPK